MVAPSTKVLAAAVATTAVAVVEDVQSCTQQITFYTQGTGCSGSAQSYANHNCGNCDTANGQTYSCDGSTATTIDWATLDCHGAILHTYTHALNQCTGWNSDVDAMITCFGAEEEVTALINVTSGPTPKFDPQFASSPEVAEVEEQLAVVGEVQSCTQQITFYTQGTSCSGSAQSYANHNCGDCDTVNGQTYTCDGSTATTIDWATYDCHGAILHTYTHSLNQCTGWNSDVDAMITCFGAEDAAVAGNVTLGPTPKFDPKFSTSALVV